MNKLIKLLVLVSSSIFIFACSNKVKNENITGASKEEMVNINVGLPKAPPALPILRMKESKALGENVNINISIWDEPESLIAMVQGNEHEIFAFPLTVISKLFNKGSKLELMNVNTWGVTSFLTRDPDFTSWEDLKGKTIYVPLQSSPPDILTQYFLKESGLEVGKDVKVEYGSMAEISQLILGGQAEYATLIEPQVTRVLMNDDKVRLALSFEKEWQRINNTKTMIPNAGIGGKTDFILENKDLILEFEKEYERALNWTLENPKEAGILAEKYLGLNKELIEKSIPNMGLNYKSANNARDELSMFYNLLFDFNPKSIGGSIPTEEMYYEN